MKTITVVVNKKRIKAGEIGDCGRCPVALGVRAHKGCRTLEVGRDAIETYRGRIVANLPARVVNWIYKFDQFKKVKPIKFKLTLDL